MKSLTNFLLIMLFLSGFFSAQAQSIKPALDTASFKKWPFIEDVKISNDGKYSMFTSTTKTQRNTTLTIINNDSKRKVELKGFIGGQIDFSDDSRFAYFMKAKDSLGVVRLADFTISYKIGVSNFTLSGYDRHEWLVCTKVSSRDLTIEDLRSGKKKILDSVVNFRFSPSGRFFLSIRKVEGQQQLDWLDLLNDQYKIIVKAEKIGGFNFDQTETEVAVIVSDRSNDFALYQFDAETGHLNLQASKTSLPDTTYSLLNDEMPAYNTNGQFIRLRLSKRVGKRVDEDHSNVTVWNYKDDVLPNLQWKVFTDTYASLNLSTKKVVILNPNGESLESSVNAIFQKYLLFSKKHKTTYPGQLQYRRDYILVDLSTGEQSNLCTNKFLSSLTISPDHKYVVWFDNDSLHWFSHEIVSGKSRNISFLLSNPLYDTQATAVGRKRMSYPLAAWNTKDHSVWIYDEFDIWQLDLNAALRPVCLTKGIGRKLNCFFGLLGWPAYKILDVDLHKNKPLYLTAFNRASKQNGFWSLSTNFQTPPQLLSMSDSFYYLARNGNATGFVEYPKGINPVKANNADRFILSKANSSNFPNLEITSDFKQFQVISELHPEKNYNWLTTELIHWKMSDGRLSSGILYKPENFDPQKKYPLIFDYYEKRSDELHQYIYPDWCTDRINIPYYVSNGYLVFVPDIYYTPGHNGDGVLNAVGSAADFLVKYPFVDSTKLGLQGHSFGGWETNYLITHTNLFAAACEASGVSDQVSSYNQLDFGGTDRHSLYELNSQGSPYGIGVTPSNSTALYIKNSPVTDVDRVTTPLLMMHGDNDDAVPFNQAVEMFLALNRAGKKVWLLQYRDAGHILFSNDAKDYTVRMKQFFDHYLKDTPAPIWMKQGWSRASASLNDLTPDPSKKP